jgi:hypothetical protein
MKRSALVALGSITLAGCIADGPLPDEKTAVAAQPIVESLVTPSRQNVIRYLEQSTFGPTLTSVTYVHSVGISAAITGQLAAPVTVFDTDVDAPAISAQFFYNAMTQTNQLRQRTAFALSQILVISQATFGTATDDGRVPMGGYLNKLSADAFKNFRTVMYDMTVNPAMGRFLNMVNNNAFTTAGTPLPPNENYARELLQLFTLGVDLLNDDGTPALDANGQRQDAYSQDQVENLSHVLTGWTYGGLPCPATVGLTNPVNYTVPMIPCYLNHDNAKYDLLDGDSTVQGALPAASLNVALDSIFYHQNVPPFISKQLIQHLVTSNPSPAYVGRVVAKFKDDGTGVRGNLGAVVRAILEDDEARGAVPPLAQQAQYGHLRSPALLITSALRWLNTSVTLANPVVPPPPVTVPPTPLPPADGAVQLSNYSAGLRQSVPRPTTVFSYYPPSSPLPGNPALVGPEFGITDTGTAFGRSNFLNNVFLRGIPNVTVDWSVLPTDTTLLMTWLDHNMMHDTMSSQLYALVSESITDPTVPVASQQALAVYLVTVSPEYQVQH